MNLEILSNFDSYETQRNKLNTNFEAVGEKIDSVEEEVDGINGKIGEIQTEVNVISGNVDILQEDMVTAKDNISTLNSKQLRANLASSSWVTLSSANTLLMGVTGVLPVANGGTGVTSISALGTALENEGFGGSGASVYDLVITTQDEFDEMIASSDWLGATCVALKGDFTITKQVDVPKTVLLIDGFMMSTISITGGIDSYIGFRGELLYSDYKSLTTCIRGINFELNTTKASSIGRFRRIDACNITSNIDVGGYAIFIAGSVNNCVINITNNKDNCSGIHSAKNINGCYVSVTSISGNVYALNGCDYVTNCELVATTSSYNCRCLQDCNYVSNTSLEYSNGSSAFGGTNTYIDRETVG